MKAVIDDKIPYIREAASRLFDTVAYRPGAEFTASDVKDADVLIVRTRTHCDRALLEGSRVKFVATATIGYDHLDTSYLDSAGIGWANQPGCNASSVGQYVESTALLLMYKGLLDPARSVIGIVGVGHVGTQVELRLRGLGFSIMRCDPPRQQAEVDEYYTLSQLAEACDMICFHVPFTRQGPYPTYHMADENFMNALRKRPVLLNAARGGVVDEQALLRAMDKGQVGGAVVDTWENEPHINQTLLNRALIATPHVAGYSADGKARATQMALESVCRYFHMPIDFEIKSPKLPASLRPAADEAERKLQLYDPRRDTAALRRNPAKFEWLRGNYPLRREVWDQ